MDEKLEVIINEYRKACASWQLAVDNGTTVDDPERMDAFARIQGSLDTIHAHVEARVAAAHLAGHKQGVRDMVEAIGYVDVERAEKKALAKPYEGEGHD